MPRFIAVHTIPMTEEQAMATMTQLPARPAGVEWKQTYCDFDGSKYFCVWEAPSKEVIEQFFRKIELPFDAVHPVRIFDVATGTIEPAPKAAVV